MELMVYNRFHRVMNASVQKAVRLLTGGSLADGWDAQMGVLNQLIASLPAESAAAEHVAQFQGQPDARVADSLLQPVELRYTVESLSALAASCGLEIVTYHVSEWDKADDRVSWNMRWTDRDLQARYDALPDLTRWQISNLLMAEQSPMLWFYLQRADCGRPIKSEPQIVGEFLDRRFRRTQTHAALLHPAGQRRVSAEREAGAVRRDAGVGPVSAAPRSLRRTPDDARGVPAVRDDAGFRERIAGTRVPGDVGVSVSHGGGVRQAA